MHNDDARIIVALDVPDQVSAESLLRSFGRRQPFVKVGMQLFYATGPKWVHQLKARGYSVFLDLKLHDIPQTVFLAAQRLARLDVEFLTVHIAGGQEMCRAAVAGVKSVQRPLKTKIVGITQLTSTDERVLNDEIGISGSVKACVDRYARLGKAVGLAGVVCSGWEVAHIKKTLGKRFLTITPGIRLSSDDRGDQKRVMTPKEALAQGADYLVIGRSITQAEDPASVYQTLVDTL